MKKIFIILFWALVFTGSLGAQTKYAVTIQISDDVLSFLKRNNYFLYGFKAVKSSGSEGQPLVWIQTDDFMEFTMIRWREQYNIYDSTNEIRDRAKMVVLNQAPVAPGDICTILPKTGLFKIVTGGPAGKIIINDTYAKSRLTTGIAQMVNGQMQLECAFPIINQLGVTIEPVHKVVFLFATQKYDPGSVMIQTPNPAILIDLTGVSSRTVVYNKDGWLDNNEIWVEHIPADAALARYLIIPEDPVRK
jgi:hypothetical protein